VIYKELTWQRLLAGARETVRATATIMFIVSSAAIFAWVLTVEQVPAQMSDLLGFDPVVLLMLTNVILLIVGMFMESIAAIMVMTPLLVPPRCGGRGSGASWGGRRSESDDWFAARPRWG
jgi:TRAP-type C4-dicarboxylate transport system permease large subunit